MALGTLLQRSKMHPDAIETKSLRQVVQTCSRYPGVCLWHTLL